VEAKNAKRKSDLAFKAGVKSLGLQKQNNNPSDLKNRQYIVKNDLQV